MPLLRPTQAQEFDLAALTPAFVRALLALNDYQGGGRSPAQLQRAAWAQRFFYVQGLNPRTNVGMNPQVEAGLNAILELRARCQQDVANAQKNPPVPARYKNNNDLVAVLLKSPCKEGMDFLKQAFGTRNANGVTPIRIRINHNEMRSTGRNALERCTTLTEASDLLKTELVGADNAEAAAQRPKRYEVALRPIPDADFTEYDTAWADLDVGLPSNVYDSVSAALLAPPNDALIYGPLPPEFPPGANQDDPFAPFVP
jgi:hypothetical protein